MTMACRLSDHGLPYCYANPCSETEARPDLRQRSRPTRRIVLRTRAVRIVLDGLFRPSRLASVAGPSNSTWGPFAVPTLASFVNSDRTRASTRSATFRKPPPSPPISTCSSRSMLCHAPSFTTTIRPTITSSRPRPAIFRTSPLPERSSLAVDGGFSIKRKASSCN